jgi:hypothetical protein
MPSVTAGKFNKCLATFCGAWLLSYKNHLAQDWNPGHILGVVAFVHVLLPHLGAIILSLVSKLKKVL